MPSSFVAKLLPLLFLILHSIADDSNFDPQVGSITSSLPIISDGSSGNPIAAFGDEGEQVADPLNSPDILVVSESDRCSTSKQTQVHKRRARRGCPQVSPNGTSQKPNSNERQNNDDPNGKPRPDQMQLPEFQQPPQLKPGSDRRVCDHFWINIPVCAVSTRVINGAMATFTGFEDLPVCVPCT